MTDRIRATVAHMSYDEAREQAIAREGKLEISDSAAVTIAAAWQSSGPVGRHLATLASGMSVDVSDLLDDIRATRPEALSAGEDLMLDMLATWALNHPSRVGRSTRPASRT